MLEKIAENFPDGEFLIADGFDEAIIGVDERDMKLVYSIPKCIELLKEKEGLSEEDAIEYFNFNVSGSYVGEKTPIWIYDEF